MCVWLHHWYITTRDPNWLSKSNLFRKWVWIRCSFMALKIFNIYPNFSTGKFCFANTTVTFYNWDFSVWVLPKITMSTYSDVIFTILSISFKGKVPQCNLVIGSSRRKDGGFIRMPLNCRNWLSVVFKCCYWRPTLPHKIAHLKQRTDNNEHEKWNIISNLQLLCSTIL